MSRLLIVFLVAILCTNQAQADPNHKDPFSVLDVHDSADTKQVYASAIALYQKLRQAMLQFRKLADERKLNARHMNAMGQTYVALDQLYRQANILIQRGEPAGFDLLFRRDRMRDNLVAMFGQSYANTPGANRVSQIQAKYAKSGKALQREADQIAGLVEQESWDQAAKRLYAFYDSNRNQTCFLTRNEQNSIYKIFLGSDAAIKQALQAQQRQEANEALIQRRDSQKPNYASLTTQMDAAAQAIGETGKYTINGTEVNGPAAISAFGSLWKQSHLGFLRCRAIEWARCSVLQTGSTPELTEMREQQAAFVEKMHEAIASIITADAGRAEQAEATGLYNEYLRSLAPLISRGQQEQTPEPIAAALNTLAEKSPTLALDVEAYALATDELIRWRKRAATSRATALRKKYPSLPARFEEGTRNYLFGADFQAEMGVPLYLALQQAQKTIYTQPASAGSTFGLPRGGFIFGQYSERTWASIDPVSVDTQANLLKKDLLVGEDSAALTLRAFRAIVAAEQGDFEAVGGDIKGLHVESLVTRFATLPSSAWALVSLGPQPAVRLGNSDSGMVPEPLKQMVMRFDLKPKWVQHELFCTEL